MDGKICFSAKNPKFFSTELFIKEMKKKQRQKLRYEKKKLDVDVPIVKVVKEKIIKPLFKRKRGRPLGSFKVPRNQIPVKDVNRKRRGRVSKSQTLQFIMRKKAELEHKERERMLRRQAREAFFMKRRQVKLDMQEDLKDQRNFFLKLHKLQGTAQRLYEIFQKLHESVHLFQSNAEMNFLYSSCLVKMQVVGQMLDQCLETWEDKKEMIQSRQQNLVENTHCVTNSDGEEFFEIE